MQRRCLQPGAQGIQRFIDDREICPLEKNQGLRLLRLSELNAAQPFRRISHVEIVLGRHRTVQPETRNDLRKHRLREMSSEIFPGARSRMTHQANGTTEPLRSVDGHPTAETFVRAEARNDPPAPRRLVDKKVEVVWCGKYPDVFDFVNSQEARRRTCRTVPPGAPEARKLQQLAYVLPVVPVVKLCLVFWSYIRKDDQECRPGKPA